MNNPIAAQSVSKGNARRTAVAILGDVVVKGRSLSSAKSRCQTALSEQRDRALAMELVNGVLRWRFRLEFLLSKLLKKPLRKKDADLQFLLLTALYELLELSTPDYAVVNEAVSLTRKLKKQWASAMVNGVLRSFIRDKEALMAQINEQPEALYAHPVWLIERLHNDWPQHYSSMLDENNRRPPMWLRVNSQRVSVEDYLEKLQAEGITYSRHPVVPTAVKLDNPLNISALPGFDQGLVSVQDAGAQLAGELLEANPGERVLDLCAAPGGKTCHLLEQAQAIEMTAVELEPERMQRVQENLDRLGLSATLITGDAANVDSWWDGKTFDRILVDAPCSASGVIRRHPDIKSLRREDDIKALVDLQQAILQQAWMMLKPGGELLYVTCSVLRQENEKQVEYLLAHQSDAEHVELNVDWGQACIYGRQLMPGEKDADGFYFARLKKSS